MEKERPGGPEKKLSICAVLKQLSSRWQYTHTVTALLPWNLCFVVRERKKGSETLPAEKTFYSIDDNNVSSYK